MMPQDVTGAPEKGVEFVGYCFILFYTFDNGNAPQLELHPQQNSLVDKSKQMFYNCRLLAVFRRILSTQTR